MSTEVGNAPCRSWVAAFMMENARRWVAVIALATLAAAEADIALEWHGRANLQLLFFGFAAILGFAAVGVWRQRMWGRWIALAAGITGVANFGMYALAFGVDPALRSAELWSLFVPSIAIVASLSEPSMAEQFAVHFRPQSIWRRSDYRVKLLGAAIVTSLSAVAMMLVFGATVPMFADEVLTATAVVAVGIGLTASGRAAGELVVGASAIGLGTMAFGLGEVLAHAPAYSPFGRMMRDSAMFAMPSIALAAITGALAFAVFAKKMWQSVMCPVDPSS